MSNKSGTSSQVISLPKGGGALHGIGEKFSPDLFTGTGNFTVPIALPPGRNGFQPELNLVYSTGNGNGPFGLGWGFSIPGISRKTSKGIPRYDESDIFVLSGAEDLVPVPVESPAPGITRYRPRTEGLFAHIDRHQEAGNDYWEVRSKDGLVSIYGTKGLQANAATIAQPDKPSQIFAWKLTETTDPFGNRIVYEYEPLDIDNSNGHHGVQLYLHQIRYVDYTNDNEADKFLVSVTFDYETLPNSYPEEIPDERRIYPFSEYRAGFEIRTRKRCTRIAIATHAGRDELVRTYDPIYLDQRTDLTEGLPRNGVSVLSQIKVTGHGGEQPEALPPLEFGYTRFEPKGRRFFPVEGQALPAQSLGSPDLELADLLGNGLPDILEMNGTVRYWRNLGNGRFDLPREIWEAPAGVSLADPGVQLIDANGDGRIDLLVTTPELSGYYPLQFDPQPGDRLWDRRSFQRYTVAPSFNLEDPEVKLIDLNGDGVTDAVRSGSWLECFESDPRRGWQERDSGRAKHYQRRIAGRQNFSFADPLFSKGWTYAPPTDKEKGQKATMFYDPRGQVIRTVNPDGSEQRVIYGVPILDQPEEFTPSPWEVFTYDPNDKRDAPPRKFTY